MTQIEVYNKYDKLIGFIERKPTHTTKNGDKQYSINGERHWLSSNKIYLSDYSIKRLKERDHTFRKMPQPSDPWTGLEFLFMDDDIFDVLRDACFGC